MITRGLEAASKGMQSLIQYEDVVANNMANINTTGFKRSNITFKDMMQSQITQKAPSPQYKTRDVGSVSLGNAADRTYLDFSQGPMNLTGSKLDLAIQGDGFFKMRIGDTINSPDKEENYYYTRNGNFHLNTDNYMINAQGDFIMDEQNRRIRLVRNPEDPNLDQNNRIDMEKELLISEDGLIQLVNGNATMTMQRIQMVDFQDKTKVSSIGEGKFLPIKGQDAGLTRKTSGFSLQQGFLEGANANTVREMINSINVSRSYETLAKIVKVTGDTVSNAIELGKIKG